MIKHGFVTLREVEGLVHRCICGFHTAPGTPESVEAESQQHIEQAASLEQRAEETHATPEAVALADDTVVDLDTVKGSGPDSVVLPGDVGEASDKLADEDVAKGGKKK